MQRISESTRCFFETSTVVASGKVTKACMTGKSGDRNYISSAFFAKLFHRQLHRNKTLTTKSYKTTSTTELPT